MSTDTEVQESKQENLGPYNGSYRSDVYVEESKNEATLDEQSNESSPYNEETISLSNIKEEDKTEQTEHDFKKRYDDLKKHYDSRLEDWKQEKEDLLYQVEQSQPVTHKTVEDLEEFKNNYPDVYGVVETISSQKTSEEVEKLRDEIKRLNEREEQLVVKSAYQELLALHPDFADIKKSEEFINWLNEQPPSISNGIIDNSSDVRWASRVLDLYKADIGLTKKRSRSKKKDSIAAAQAVTKTNTVNVATSNNANKKMWTTSEIRKLKPHEFDKFEKEIDQARVEGRILNQ